MYNFSRGGLYFESDQTIFKGDEILIKVLMLSNEPDSYEQFPIDIEILGASGDHLVVDAKNTQLQTGDEVRFDVDYAGMISAMSSAYVEKVYLGLEGEKTEQ